MEKDRGQRAEGRGQIEGWKVGGLEGWQKTIKAKGARQRAEDRGQRTEDRGQRAEDRRQETEGSTTLSFPQVFSGNPEDVMVPR